MLLIPTAKNLIFSKNDLEDIRLGEKIHFLNDANQLQSQLMGSDFTILGYPNDLGIHLNGGRTGASAAPDSIRKHFFKMTPNPFIPECPKILDCGNVNSQQFAQNKYGLDQLHSSIFNISKQIFSESFLISLGGGHDFAFPDGSAFLENVFAKNHEQNTAPKPLIINFDAHLDVRPDDTAAHSGTPFRKLLSRYPHQFDLYEVGIQSHCNSVQHLKWAESMSACILSSDLIQQKGLFSLLTENLEPNNSRPLWISLDVDVFSSAVAPGCSQSWINGLDFKEFLHTFKWLLNNFKTYGLGIYEVSPPLDTDDQTSKLAAVIIHQAISTIQRKK